MSKKIITLAKAWRDQVDSSTVHEYPAGWSGEVDADAAERAHAAKVVSVTDAADEGAQTKTPKPKA